MLETKIMDLSYIKIEDSAPRPYSLFTYIVCGVFRCKKNRFFMVPFKSLNITNFGGYTRLKFIAARVSDCWVSVTVSRSLKKDKNNFILPQRNYLSMLNLLRFHLS